MTWLKTILNYLRGIIILTLAWLFLVPYSLLFVLLAIISFRKLSDPVLHIAARGWGRVLLFIAGIKVDVQGAEKMNQRIPRIIIFNHQSMLDMLWLAVIFPPGGVAVIKKEFKYIPVVNLALWASGFIFIDRSNREQALSSIKAAAAKIRQYKLSLFMAPEGTRTHTGEILPFKKGPFHIAMESQLPIYPIVVHGAYELLPKNRLIPSRGTMYVRCLDPIDTSQFKNTEIDQLMKAARELIVKEHSSLQQYSALA